MWSTIQNIYIFFKVIVHPKNENLLIIYTPSGHPRHKWVCFFMRTDLEKCSITSLAHQWILCSERVNEQKKVTELLKITVKISFVQNDSRTTLHFFPYPYWMYNTKLKRKSNFFFKYYILWQAKSSMCAVPCLIILFIWSLTNKKENAAFSSLYGSIL